MYCGSSTAEDRSHLEEYNIVTVPHGQMFPEVPKKGQLGIRNRLYHILCRTGSDKKMIFTHNVTSRQTRKQGPGPWVILSYVTPPPKKTKMSSGSRRKCVNHFSKGNENLISGSKRARDSTITFQNFTPLTTPLSHKSTKALSLKIILEAVI